MNVVDSFGWIGLPGSVYPARFVGTELLMGDLIFSLHYIEICFTL